MKAIVYTGYGPPDVLQLREVAIPKPNEDQVLVRVHAASANALDYRRFEDTSPLGRIREERILQTINRCSARTSQGRCRLLAQSCFSQVMRSLGYLRDMELGSSNMRVLPKITWR